MVTTKLSYQNRKIEGEKLAQVIKKDLLKRHRPRQQTAKDASLDLIMTGKSLGAYLDLVCEGLLASIHNGAVRLGELELADNGVPTTSLFSLALVVRASAHDLHHLNLSHNQLIVETEQDLCAWRAFVAALATCSALQSIDLSDNPLGDEAIEVLARYYCRQSNAEMTVASLAIATSPMRTQQVDDRQHDSSDPERHRSVSHAGSHEITSFRGVRGFARLRLDRTEQTDAGALFLSFVVEHTPISQLITYADNEYSNAGLRLLEAAESVRLLSTSPSATTDTNFVDDLASKSPIIGLQGVKLSVPNTPKRSPVRRRSSIDNEPVSPARCLSHKIDDAEHAVEVLERFRVKIQGSVLKSHTEDTLPVNLWRSALYTLRLARLLMHGRSSTGNAARLRLGIHLWQRILLPLTDPCAALSHEQRRKVFEYATSEQAMSACYNVNEKLPHVKVWHTLEMLDCLAYEYAA
ncbi:hypothetical protein BCR37DRAFT_387065 [Protomyces lactucae-debilis]|uniref:Uncharacterized protein n=1 Tax=Protomyces lactucae-debilis TaxID=2754530 RepID=A0A1Y2FH11_PROLT|nr:uncharacterized protein BCR37DRAFT_387065 [Protomyces lactucae-debilis]ORY83213.1 hypothetical protein BCR37DRAFT_387065 [Protomyces lactucae-debilis]